MTTPSFDITELIPSKYKALVGLIGSALTFAVPYLLQITDALGGPWPAVIGLVLAVLTALGIYRAPYKPTDAVLVHESQVSVSIPPPVPSAPVDLPEARYRNPWKS